MKVTLFRRNYELYPSFEVGKVISIKFLSAAAFTASARLDLGDYDGDGDLDIVAVGATGVSGTKVYRNDGNFVFVDVNATILGVQSDVRWIDYDGDGDLDIVLTGNTGSVKASKIFRNDGADSFVDSGIALEGADSSAVSVVDFNGDGRKDILLAGNGTSNPIAKYYRNDGGGVFTDVNLGLTGVSSPIVGWGDYDGDGDPDLLLAGMTFTGVVSIIYRNDGSNTMTNIHPTVMPGTGDGGIKCGDYNNDGHQDLFVHGNGGLGNYAMLYRNTGGGVFVSSGVIVPQFSYGDMSWGDYDNDGDLDYVMCGSSLARVYRNNGNNTFTDIGAGLQGVWQCSVDWGDYNNDGFLDIVLTGQGGTNHSKVYRNNGNSTFTDVVAGLTPVRNGATRWSDYDGDGDLDILLTGQNDGGTMIAVIYRNDSGVFVDSGNALSSPLYYNNSSWVDYDGDGDLDAVVGARVYRNTAGVFAQATYLGSYDRIYWADMDGDGDSDALGVEQFLGYRSVVSVNNGSGTLTPISQGNVGANGAATWCDIDNDGDLDFATTGEVAFGSAGKFVRIYRNNTFPKITGQVTLSGQPLQGVALVKAGIQLATTDSSGAYNAIGLSLGGDYILTPTLTGYTFSPASVTGTLASTVNYDFAATLRHRTKITVSTSRSLFFYRSGKAEVTEALERGYFYPVKVTLFRRNYELHPRTKLER